MPKLCKSLSNSTIIPGGGFDLNFTLVLLQKESGPLPCEGGKINTDKPQSAEWSLSAFVLCLGLVALGVQCWGKGPCSRYGWVKSDFLLLN